MTEFNWDHGFQHFLDSLNDKDLAKTIAIIRNIEMFGIRIATRQKWLKKIGNNLYEIRVNSRGNAIRGLYFKVVDNEYFISHDF